KASWFLALRVSALNLWERVWRPASGHLGRVLGLWRLGRHRSELEGELVDRAGEFERRVIAIFDERDAGAGVLADVEGFILRECNGGAILHRVGGDLLAVHGENARAAAAYGVTVQLVIENDGVFGGRQLRPLPHGPLKVE